MYQGKTLSELAKELERQAEMKQDFKAPTTLLEMSDELNLRVGEKFSGSLTELAHDQVGKWTGIPGAYYDRMRSESPQLLAANVSHWLHTTKETRLVRTLDGRARAFLSNRYRTIDNFDVANAALPILVNEGKQLGQIKIMSAEITERRLYIKVASERLTYEVKKGDAVQMGIVISNSEVGKGSVRVEPFLYRLICLNGAIIEDSAVRKFHLGRQSAELEAAEQVYRDETRQADDRAFMLKLGDVVRASFDDVNFAKLKGMVIDATTRKIQAPISDVVEEVADRYKLNEIHKDSFLKNLIEGGDVTQWGLANAITAIANKAADYETATELEKIGGELMTMPLPQWRQLTEAAA